MKIVHSYLSDVVYAGYCLDSMEEQGVQAMTAGVGGLTVDSDTSYLTITTPPSTAVDSKPGLSKKFDKAINLRALVLTWLAAEPTSVPEGTEASTTPKGVSAQEGVIWVILKIQVKQAGDQQYKELTDMPTDKSKVRRELIVGLDEILRLPIFLIT